MFNQLVRAMTGRRPIPVMTQILSRSILGVPAMAVLENLGIASRVASP